MSAPDTTSAEHLGALEAEAFDEALRRLERSELVDRWGSLFSTAAKSDQRVNSEFPPLAPLPNAADLAHFHLAVTRSLSWRLLQALRRPLGRAW